METLQLHGWFYKQLQEALISAFPTAVSLEQFVSFNLNQNLNELAGGENLSDIVYQLMESQKACGEVCIKRLVDEASQYREYNQQVQAVKQIFDKTLDKVEYSLEFDNPVDEIEDFKVKYSIEELSENLEDPCLNYIKKDGTKIYLIGSIHFWKKD